MKKQHVQQRSLPRPAVQGWQLPEVDQPPAAPTTSPGNLPPEKEICIVYTYVFLRGGGRGAEVAGVKEI